MFPKARVALTFLAVFVALLGVVTVAYAAMYIINTNDASVAEWSTQGIAQFQTDAAGDYISPTQDIVNGWVARSLTNTNIASPTINFLMQLNSNSPLEETATLAAAIFDCDNDNVIGNDPEDRVIAYVRNGGDYMLDDGVYIGYGDFSNSWFTGASENEDHNAGQVVNNFVEWAVPLDDMDQTPGYCPATTRIRFATINITVGGNWWNPTITATTLDQVPSFRGYDMPTAVKLESLEASAHSVNAAAFGVLLGTLAAVAVGVVVVTRSRRRS